jgi:predicted Zn-dependent protease
MIKQMIAGLLLMIGMSAQAQDNQRISSAYNDAVKLIGEHKYSEAEKILTEVIREKPDYAEAISARGTSRLMQLKRDEACKDFEKAASLGWKAAERSLKTYCGKDVPAGRQDKNTIKK